MHLSRSINRRAQTQRRGVGNLAGHQLNIPSPDNKDPNIGQDHLSRNNERELNHNIQFNRVSNIFSKNVPVMAFDE